MLLHQMANHMPTSFRNTQTPVDQTQEPKKIIVGVTTSQYEIISKNQICSVKTFFSRA